MNNPDLFLQPNIKQVGMRYWGASTGEQILESMGFGSCTALLVLYQNRDQQPEVSLFHLKHGAFSPEAETQLSAINQLKGAKSAVFVTTPVSVDAQIAPDRQARRAGQRLSQMVKGIELLPTIECSGVFDLAYDLKSDTLQLNNKETKKPEYHAPFADRAQNLAAGRAAAY